ncbi:MAG: ISL3 family transposase [Sterolibacteriaceae bacterium]|uniref:ISL3 family transposase n=1 Tax=Candidatus Methylophosphatis roskildensis TaxID=2899263 RepID=A0A9D7E380_9PROT|nr:ISL3 family transposase [Candidatus Methylophosphatis roskildensis]
MKSKLLNGLERILARIGKRVVHCAELGSTIDVQACSTVRAAPCPACQSWSDRLHGRYVRCLAERPSLEQQVVIFVEIRRFKCPSADCLRRTFAEDIQSLAGRHQRRTRSQARALQALGHALGGAAAARLAASLGLRASADTVLREVRRAGVGKQRVPPQVVGIDDWAIARGHHYGTIIVDLERREPIEVFAGRETTVVAHWLRDNPSIRIVARDRAGAYSEAVAVALPAAQQVSDRWHLLGNLRDNVESMLHRLGPQLRQAAQQVEVGSVPMGRQGLPRGTALRGWQRLSDDRRAARLARYEEVMALHGQGRTMKGIARELSIDHRTVRKFVTARAFPERARRTRGPTPLDEHRGYIEERIRQGCHSPRLLWQEVRARGYTGSHSAVRDCVLRLLTPQGKDPLVKQSPRTMACPSPRRAFGWLAGWKKLNPDRPQGDEHERFVEALCVLEPSVAVVRSLTRQFLGMMHRRLTRRIRQMAQAPGKLWCEGA